MDIKTEFGIIERIKKLYAEYIQEMIASPAWMAHTDAPDYLENIETEIKAILKEIHNYDADTALFHLNTNYLQLIKKIYGSDDFTFEEKCDMTDILNDAYLNYFEEAISVLKDFYERETKTELV